MTERPKLRKRGLYFSSPKDEDEVAFFSSGSKTLDLALGGGWALRHVSNIIGDQSTGKTLLAIEGATNFAAKYPTGKVRYREFEHAFQKRYAGALGMPMDRVDFGEEPLWTVEDLFEELSYRAEHSKSPEFFIVDSLDAVSSRAELARSIDQDSYAGEKAKKMSELFRRLIGKIEQRDITLMVISQVRDKIGVRFGRKWTITGGRALDFYTSQRIVLAHLGQVYKTRNNLKRTVGITVKANVIKNKIGFAYRDSTFDILFGYGIADAAACLDWAKKHGVNLTEALGGLKESAFMTMIMTNSGDWRRGLNKLHVAVEKRWWELEQEFLPTGHKYG